MGTPRPQTKPSLLWLPSQSVLQRRGGIWGQLRFSHVIGRTQLLSGEVLALHRAVHGWCSRLGRVQSPCPAIYTLTSSSSSTSISPKVFACTVLGTEALLPVWVVPCSSSTLSQEAPPWGVTSTSSRQASMSV